MPFNLTLLPLDSPNTLDESTAVVHAECDAAGLTYTVIGTDTVVDAAWAELAPVLERAEETLRIRQRRVYMMLSADAPEMPSHRRRGAIRQVQGVAPRRWPTKAVRAVTAVMSRIRAVF